MLTNLSAAATSTDADGDVYENASSGRRGRLDSMAYGSRLDSHGTRGPRRDSNHIHGINVEAILIKTDVLQGVDANSLLSLDSIPQPKSTTSLGGGLLSFLRTHIESSLDDEAELQALLRKSNVINTKDFKQWDLQTCLSLLSGPLTTASCLSAVLKTKFIKRILSFLRPQKASFSDMPWTVANMLYVRVAVQLVRVMLTSPEGREYSFFNEFVAELLLGLLAEVERANVRLAPIEDKETSNRKTSKQRNIANNIPTRTFSRSHCSSKLAREYFTLMGVLSASPHGEEYFDKYDMFEQLIDLWKDPTRDYISRLVIQNLLYSSDKYLKPRKLLSTWLENGTSCIRDYIISHLRLLLRKDKDLYLSWIIDLCVSQLTNPDKRVALAALSVIEEACQDKEGLELLIKHCPSFKVVGSASHNLQISMLSTKTGVEYLNSIRWVEPQLRYWRAEGGGNQRYVETLENALVSALNAGVNQTSSCGRSSGDGFLSAVSPEAFSPSGQPGQQPWCAAAALYTDQDHYYFNRLHRVPWIVEISVESPKGRSIQLIAEAYLHTGYASEEEGGGLVTYAVGVLLDYEGNVKPYRFDPSVTIRARLSVGAHASALAEDGEAGAANSMPFNHPRGDFPEDPKETEKVCTPENRKGLTPDNCIIVGENMRWYFQCFPQAGPGASPAQELKSVWFRIQLNAVGAIDSAVSLAPHLYGELAKTPEGCMLIRAGGHFREFAEIIKSPHPSSIQKRAALWALGQIGSSPLGFNLLMETDIVEYVSDQAKNCHTLSMRGTCFYILGLLSRSEKARHRLANLGKTYRACVPVTLCQAQGCYLVAFFVILSQGSR